MGKSTRVAPDMMEDVPEGKREVVGVLESKGVKQGREKENDNNTLCTRA